MSKYVRLQSVIIGSRQLDSVGQQTIILCLCQCASANKKAVTYTIQVTHLCDKLMV